MQQLQSSLPILIKLKIMNYTQPIKENEPKTLTNQIERFSAPHLSIHLPLSLSLSLRTASSISLFFSSISFVYSARCYARNVQLVKSLWQRQSPPPPSTLFFSPAPISWRNTFLTFLIYLSTFLPSPSILIPNGKKREWENRWWNRPAHTAG